MGYASSHRKRTREHHRNNDTDGYPCDVCGKFFHTSVGRAQHVSRYCSKRRHLDEEPATAVNTATLEAEQDVEQDIEFQPVERKKFNEEMLRMFTDWRVHNMTDTDLQRVKEGIVNVLQIFRDKVTTELNGKSFVSIEDVFEHAGSLLDGLRDSRSERARAAEYYQPVEYHVRVLGTTRAMKPTPYGSTEVQLQDVVVENLVEDSIQQLVCTPELATEFFRDKRSPDDDIIADVHDGTLFRRHPLFKLQPSAVAWGLYGDDFEVHIAIGPAAGVRKVSLHYAVCYNLPKSVRFSINNLVLVSACYTKDVKRYGCKNVISGCGDDTSFGGSMRRFADGVVLTKINQLANRAIDEVHYGALLLFFADSPFLGFYTSRKESLSGTTERICIKCNCTSTNKAFWFSTSEEGCEWEPITEETLKQQRREITAAKQSSITAFREASKRTGLNSAEDAFLGIPWWSTPKAAFYDWFHGEAEGPVKDHVYLFVHHGVQMKYFSPAVFNTLVSL